MGSQCLYVKKAQFLQRSGRVWDWWAIIGITILVSTLLLPNVSSDPEETESVQNEENQSTDQTPASDSFAKETPPSTDAPELHSTAPNAGDALQNDNSSSEAGDSTLNSEMKNTTDSALNVEAENGTNTTVSEISLVRPKCDAGKGCDTQLYCFDFKTLPSNASVIPDPPQAAMVTPHQLESILEDQSIQNCCAVVLFYAPWCTFSVQFARKFNALGRSFENLPVLAVDMAGNEPYKYILAYLPLVAFYYRGKTLFKFRLESSFEELRDMIGNVTGFTPLEVNLTDPANDYPVPTVRDTSDHLALSLAIWWVAFIALVYAIKSGLTARCLHYLRTKLSRTKVD